MVHARVRTEVGRFPDLGLEPLATNHLDARDAAFAHALYDAVVRRWLTLEHLVAAHADRPVDAIDATVRAALLVGAAQLVFLDRVPPHAALNEAVEWTRAAGKPRATGFVNALLRRIAAAIERDDDGRPRTTEIEIGAPDRLPLADGRALELAAPLLPEDRDAWLAAATSTPAWLLDRWRAQLGEEAAENLAMHGLVHPPVVLNLRHTASPVEGDLDAGQMLTPHESGGMAVLGPPGASPRVLLAARRDAWAQDPTSADALGIASDAPPPALAVDLCAGLGTKTRQLRAVHPAARILACDANAARRKTLARVFADDDRVEVLDIDAVRYEAAGRADLVLLDVPCSNTGVLPRRPEARYRTGDAQLERLAAIQCDLLVQAQAMLAAGGHVIYATCSIDADENEAIAEWARTALGFNLVASRTTLPTGRPGDPPELYRDGGFAALLRASPAGGR